MQVGILAGFRPAGVDDDELRAALSPRRLDALVDDRMAPGGVRSDKDDQVRLIKVGIGSGHHILAKGADVSCDRARHAQAGFGVDVAAADEALHQLVRAIIILRQPLPRDIEGYAYRPVLLYRPVNGSGHGTSGLVPT